MLQVENNGTTNRSTLRERIADMILRMLESKKIVSMHVFLLFHFTRTHSFANFSLLSLPRSPGVYRMIGGVLTERTVGTVLPAVKENMQKVQVRVFKLHLGRRCAMPLSFARTFSLASSLEYGWVMMWCVGVVHNRSESVQAVCDELYTQLQNKEKQMQEFQVKLQTSSKFIKVTPHISFILYDMPFTR